MLGPYLDGGEGGMEENREGSRGVFIVVVKKGFVIYEAPLLPRVLGSCLTLINF